MKRAAYNIALILGGGLMATRWHETFALLAPYALPLGIAVGWELRGVLNETISTLGAKIIASSFGKKAVLELLADGVAKMQKEKP